MASKQNDHAALGRREHVAVAAYYNAEHRGFASGGEMDDWLKAEREFDRMNTQSGIDTRGASLMQAPEDIVPRLQGDSEPVIAPNEVQQVAAAMDVSPEELRTAIKKVGPNRRDVQKALPKARSGRAGR